VVSGFTGSDCLSNGRRAKNNGHPRAFHISHVPRHSLFYRDGFVIDLVPIYQNRIMLAYHLYDRQIKMTERSDSTNQQSTINNQQSTIWFRLGRVG
jgi:hypothetical protein